MKYSEIIEDDLTELSTVDTIYEVLRVKQIKTKRPIGYSSKIVSSTHAGNIGIKEIGDDASEVLLILALSTSNEINAMHRVFTGSLNTTVAHPREIFQSAILNNANRIIVYHNHPSGDTTPSENDLNFTKKMQQAGEILGIQLTDHIIVTDTEYLSMREEGHLRY